MDLQVKKLKVDMSATPRKNSVTGPYHFKSAFSKHQQKNTLFVKRSF